MKAIVLENDNYLRTGYEDFIKSINPNFELVNPKMNERWDVAQVTAWYCMTLSQPDVNSIIINSALEQTAWGTRGYLGIEDDKMQFEFLAELMIPILRFREVAKYPSLSVHLVYGGYDFMGDMQRGNMGETSFGTISLILRQQSNISITIYDSDYKKLKVIQGVDEA